MDNASKTKRPENPSKRANWLSLITFWYTIPTFVLGYKKKLSVENLFETLPEHKSNYLGDLIETKWKTELKRAAIAKRKPSLARVLMQMFGLSYLGHGVITAIYELFIKVVQPLALGHLIAHYSSNKIEITLTNAYIYASVIVICALLGAALKNPNVQATAVLSMKAKIACSSLIYRKTLKLNKSAIEIDGGGQILNMLSSDISKFDNFVVFANYLWITPIQTTIVAYFMFQEVGFSSIIGVTTLLLFVPYMFFLGKKLSLYRLETAKKTDVRISLMNEIINGVKAIKMFAWEKEFIKLVDKARRNEIKSVSNASYINGIIAALNLSLNHIALYVTILAYALIYYNFNAKQVFVLSLYYSILKLSVAMSFGYGITAAAAFKVSVKRLNQFMELEENQALYPIELQQNKIISVTSNKNNAITLLHGTAKWLKSSARNTLTKINFIAKQGDLVAVIGQVGSGKSSLLYTILKELPLLSGDLITNGSISYASQEPWIFPTSVRQNILFGLPMKHSRYKKVLKCCSLMRDLEIFPFGDKTIVGERGITLSGGQRARVNLARAVYKEADIYLLDDPLSAVDAQVGKELFDYCITSFLKTKTVILVTHQLQYLKDANNIMMLENGRIKREGSFNSLQKSSAEFTNLLEEAEEQNSNIVTCSEDKDDALKKSSASIATVDADGINLPKESAELLGSGLLSSDLYRIYFSVSSNFWMISCTIIFFITASCLSSLSTYFLAHWVNCIQEMGEQIQNHDNLTNVMDCSFSDFNVNIYIYSALTGTTIVISVLRSWSFYNVCMRSSIKLHDNLFRSVIRANLRFFYNNSSGRILNRFAKDISDIDELLPDNILFFLDVGCAIIGSIVLITFANPWLIIPSFIFCTILYIARTIYLVTSTDIKRLEGITKSPVFTCLNVSLQGLSTIRAFNVQSILEKEFDNHQDLHSSTLYAYIFTERALSYFVDLLCAVYIGVVLMSFLFLGDEKYGGNVGLAVSLVIGLTNGLQYCVRQSTQIYSQMTAVERVLSYTNISHEAALESHPDKKPPKSWPSKGKIVFSKLYFKYHSDENHVLKNLSFTIEPLEKIGVVGRTGAGKSSVISALFRLAHTSGSIIIDDINILSIGLHDLRSKISVIPQEPVFLSGTLRRNLDPFDDYEDHALWKALEDVELKELIASLPLGLQVYVLEGGSNFSVGQRQLICLARAIVRNNKILVLDEATANIDLKTDELIQKTIRRNFSHCTVLTIAHRLSTIMDSDKIMVVDVGKVVEFNHPHLLLQKRGGFFYNMVQQTGQKSAKALMEVAEKNYEDLHPMEDLILL